MNCRRIFCPSETGEAAVVEQNFFRNTREAGIPQKPGYPGSRDTPLLLFRGEPVDRRVK